MSNNKRLLLVDGTSYIYRAFFALPFLSNSKGIPTNAVYGFARMINKLLNEYNPTHMAVVFDVSRSTFRTERFREYKAHRPKMPDELSIQIPYIKKLLASWGIPKIELAGYEADDIIGTLAKEAEKESWQVLIVSPDKDLCQLVTPKISMYDPMNDRIFTPEEVYKKFGVSPQLIPTLLALVGDPTDNIPGVKGIGKKRAKEIIDKLGNLEQIYKRLDALPPSLKKKLSDQKELAFLSYELAQIKADLPLPFEPAKLEITPQDQQALRELFVELEFSSLLKDLPKPKEPVSTTSYRTAKSLKEIKNYLKDTTELSFDLETTSLDAIEAEIVGISVSVKEKEALYIPVGHKRANNLDLQKVLNTLSKYLSSPNITKVGQNLKYEFSVLSKYGVEVILPIFDTMVASYLINPLKKRHNLDELSLEYLGHKMISYQEATSSLISGMDFSHLTPKEACTYACEDADITLRLKNLLSNKLKEEGLEEVFYEIEMPIVPVLAHMETKGVKVDREKLENLGKFLSTQLEKIESEIYQLAGERFNINSPRQLSRILFEKLKLKPKKKTKTGYSTDTEVLEALSLEHPLPGKVLEYRQLAKLKSTYVDGLIKQINPLTGRIHTSYSQTATATGRLSSRNPNLQNIPIKSDLGKLIREAFVAEDGYLLVSADYSQIELRILAVAADEPKLKEAFIQGEDIHTRTACEIFGVSPDEVTHNMRRTAKVVNFGIIYGMSAYGLAKELKIPQEEAQKYIDRYFSKYPNVVRFIKRTVEEAKKNGFVKTLFGRKRPVPELFSPKRDEREFGKRAAVNAPIQGTAADIIKIAMAKTYQYIKENNLNAYMILQVHDELVFEVEESIAQEFSQNIRKIMEGIAPELDVPLKVDLKIGKTWAD